MGVRKITFRGWLLLALPATLLSAAPHRLRVHPNATIVIHSIAQGPGGLLLPAASEGLYRLGGFRSL